MGTDSNRPDPTDPIVDDVDLDSLIDEVAGKSEDTTSQEQSEIAAVSNVVNLLPVHAAPYTQGRPRAEGGGDALKVQRRVGRPRKVERMPTTSDLEYHAQITEQKAKFVEADSVVQAAVAKADPMAMLAVIKTEVAKESAALHFQRIENEKYGKDTAQVSTRRIDALKKIADIELEIKKLGGSQIDVNGEQMQRVFKFFVETVRAILEENLSVEQLDLVFNRLQTEFEGWQEKVAAVLR
jgi:hypothetical protein